MTIKHAWLRLWVCRIKDFPLPCSKVVKLIETKLIFFEDELFGNNWWYWF
jgi:hypothetical protein